MPVVGGDGEGDGEEAWIFYGESNVIIDCILYVLGMKANYYV